MAPHHASQRRHPVNTTTTKKATGAATPMAQKDRTQTNDHDRELILPAITGIVTLALLLTGWSAYEYEHLPPAIALLALAAAIQIALECCDRHSRTGRPARVVASVARLHGRRRGRKETTRGRHLASRITRPVREPVHSRIQQGTGASVDRRNALTEGLLS